MIYQIRGKLQKKDERRVIVDVGGVCYEIYIPRTVFARLEAKVNETIDLTIYHYFSLDKNKAVPILVGFIDELEKDFFEKFITVSGVGPRAAVKAFDKPVASIARAIEEGDIEFLTTLVGIGKQRAKQIVAHLQGKVGRFALLKEEAESKKPPVKKELIEEGKEILKRLQYNTREAEAMLKRALAAKPNIENIEELLNEIYRQRI